MFADNLLLTLIAVMAFLGPLAILGVIIEGIIAVWVYLRGDQDPHQHRAIKPMATFTNHRSTTDSHKE